MEDNYIGKWQMRLLKMKKQLHTITKKGVVNPPLRFPKDSKMGRFSVNYLGSNNEICIGKNFSTKFFSVSFRGDSNRVVIDDDCELNGVSIQFSGSGCTLHFCNRARINAHRQNTTSFHIGGGTTLTIDEDSAISNGVTFYTTDYHGLYDHETLRRINPDKDTVIGKHVIIFMRAVIMKGSYIGDGCAVGCNSVVAGHFAEPNCVIAGNPAHVVRHGVIWDFGKDDTLPDAHNYFGTEGDPKELS